MRHERQYCGLGLRKDALRPLDPGRTQRGDPGRATTLYGAALSQHIARGRRLGCKRGRVDREPLTPLARGAEVDMDEARPQLEAEAEATDLPRCRLVRHRLVSHYRCLALRLA